MARMHPDDIEGYPRATEGEKRVFRFLREAARPQEDWIGWYAPPTGAAGKEPDFVLFGDRLGLLVLEVKDWTIRQILSYTPHTFTLRIGGKTQKKTNPDRQAKGYVNALVDRLRGVREFAAAHPFHEGGIRIPVGRMVVFPHIARREYFDRGLQWLIPVERALFREDLEGTGEILRDTSGKRFQERVSGSLPFRFRGLGGKARDRLCFALWPGSDIELPQRQGPGRDAFAGEVRALDEAQAGLARGLGAGHRIVKGPSGSGKTLVLVHRCCQLRRYDPRVKRILLVCYNIALTRYLARLIQEKGLGLGESGIEVRHFYDLCSRILGEAVSYENEGDEYYGLVTQEALARVRAGESRVGHYDAVLVDEGQDFDGPMLATLMALLRSGGDLVIALDPYQDLYRRKIPWKALGIKAAGRTVHLKRVYRNTTEVFAFTRCFMGAEIRGDGQLALLPEDCALQGPRPELRRFGSQAEVESFVLDHLQDSMDREDFKRSEIALVYDDKIYGPERFAYDNRALPMRLLVRLEAAGIPATWVSQDVRSKEMYDVTTDRVSLISIHSAKGLDFDLVYLMGLDHIQPSGATREKLTALVYVAMTRAKYRLVIPYVQETELIGRMKDCLARQARGGG